MINFKTNNDRLYCKIIHNFLEVQLFGDPDIDVGDMIECYMPEYLYREQYQKCLEVFEDLYEWTEDSFLHDLTPFHELALYNFLSEINNMKNDYQEYFKNIFYDKETQNEIKKFCKKKSKNKEIKQYTFLESEEDYYNPDNICDEIFEDTDFLLIDKLYNEQKENKEILADTLGINSDYYFELLPIDIQKKHKSKHITLNGEVDELFNYLQRRIDNSSLSQLFWEAEKPIKETKIHTILENIMDAYFIGKDVDISREVLIKNGKVDFKLFRSNQKEDKILIEVKKASNSYLKAGYEKQLTDYIKYSDYKNAFYLIVCFTDKDYKVATNFINKTIHTSNYQMYINIKLLDVRKKLSPSKKLTSKNN